MKKTTTLLALIAIIAIFLNNQAHAITLNDANYKVETYAQFQTTDIGRGPGLETIRFDNAGNIYLLQRWGSTIYKIDQNKNSSLLATFTGDAKAMEYGGGGAYGDNLYMTLRGETVWDDTIVRVDMSGNVTTFGDMSPPAHGVTPLALDTTGNYGNMLYTSTSGQDKTYSISPTGNKSLFGNFPGWTDGGGPHGIDFDDYGNFGGKMFMTTSYGTTPALSGLFSIDPQGNATKFASEFVNGFNVEFDTVGAMFDGDLFIHGRKNTADPLALWRIDPQGNSTLFSNDAVALTFGPDGAMYTAELIGSDYVINRVSLVPEPATMTLLTIGGIAVVRRRSKL